VYPQVVLNINFDVVTMGLFVAERLDLKGSEEGKVVGDVDIGAGMRNYFDVRTGKHHVDDGSGVAGVGFVLHVEGAKKLVSEDVSKMSFDIFDSLGIWFEIEVTHEDDVVGALKLIDNGLAHFQPARVVAAVKTPNTVEVNNPEHSPINSNICRVTVLGIVSKVTTRGPLGMFSVGNVKVH